MQITKNSLIEKDSEFFGWFLKNFGNNTVDAYAVVEKLREQKSVRSWMFWLFTRYRLSGLCESFYADGILAERCAYKGGKEDGLYEHFYPDGSLSFRCAYKDGKRDGTTAIIIASNQIVSKA